MANVSASVMSPTTSKFMSFIHQAVAFAGTATISKIPGKTTVVKNRAGGGLNRCAEFLQ